MFKTCSVNAALVNGEVKVSRANYCGISARVLNKTFGFASSSSLSDEKKVLKKARALARLGTGNENYKMLKTRPEKADLSENKFPDYDIDRIVAQLKHLDKFLVHPAVTTRTVSIRTYFSIKHYENDNSTNVCFNDVWSYFSVYAVAKKGNIMEQWSERKAWLNTLGDLSSLSYLAEKTKHKAIKLLSARHVKKGSYTVVLDPDMTGLFTHEAVGHACEADTVLGKASVFDKPGAKVGASNFKITDYSNHEKGFGNIDFDDQGVRAKPVTLIDKGILKSYMHSRLTSAMMSKKVTGNSRMQDYLFPPIVRMRNTVLESAGGSFSDDEVKDIRKGILVKGMNGGSVDPLTGTFMFGAKEAYTIEKGEPKQHLRDVTILGNIRQTLMNITAVGRTVELGPGFCGKQGQRVRVSDGGPFIRVKGMVVG